MSNVYLFDSCYKDSPRIVLCEQPPCYNESTEDPLDPEEQHRKDLERLQNFRLIDDDFMRVVFDQDIECTTLLLRIILNRNDLTVLEVKSQYAISDLQKRSIYLDIRAVDAQGVIYNIEVQRSNKGAGAKRARYHGSLIDAASSSSGDDFDDLAEIYVIFITENDVLGDGRPIYHIDRIVRETGKPFDDQSHIIYINSQIRNETALGRLMHDFWCTQADDMHYRVLAERVRHFKEDKEGQNTMCEAIEQMRNEVAQAAGRAQAIRMARRMLAAGRYDDAEIADCTELTLDEVRALAEQQPA